MIILFPKILILDDENDQPPEGEEEKEAVTYQISNEVRIILITHGCFNMQI